MKELALPIGWNLANVSDQLNCELPRGTTDLPSEWAEFYNICLGDQVRSIQASDNLLQAFLFSAHNLLQNVVTIVVKYPLALIRILLGWLIAGIAISMGAPFWFDLLGKFVNVRNAGGRPSSIETQSVAKPAAAEIIVKKES